MEKTVHLVTAVELEARGNASRHVLGLFVESLDAQLYVNYWFGGETRHRRRANVVNAQCGCSQTLGQPVAPYYKGARPARVIRHDFDLITHPNGGHLLKTGPDHFEGARGERLTLSEWQAMGSDTSRLCDEVVEVHQIYAFPLSLSALTP
jgi:hypothetical protein